MLTRTTIQNLPPLPASFYAGHATKVAKKLLGKGLVVKHKDELLVLQLTEVEAYTQLGDESCHSYRGITKRNWPMFEAGGTCYVYLSYGINYCMNIATGRKGVGDAVLLRAGIPLLGEEMMLRNRGLTTATPAKLTGGPGKLTQALGIDLAQNGLTFDRKDLKIVDLGIKIPTTKIIATTRIGISKAKDLPWRFLVTDYAQKEAAGSRL